MAFSNLEKAMAAIIGIDLAAPGTSRAVAKTLVRASARAAPTAARAAGLTNPYALGAGLGFGALATPPGQELLAAAEERGRQDRLQTERFVQDTLALAPIKAKRKATKYGKAIKAGMAAVKASTTNGKKGILKKPSVALAQVSKIASGVKKKKKAPKSGIRRKIYTAVKKYI